MSAGPVRRARAAGARGGWRALWLGAALLGVARGPLLAHGLALWAELRDGQVHVEAYASDGTPLADAPLRVLDAAGAERLRARTDRAGALRFAAPGDADALCIRLELDAAHRAQFELTLRGSPAAPCAPAVGADRSRAQSGPRR